jgi:hypothetical protein
MATNPEGVKPCGKLEALANPHDTWFSAVFKFKSERK